MPPNHESLLTFSDEKLHDELRQYELLQYETTGGRGSGYGAALRNEIARRAAERQTAILTLAATILPLIVHR